jgi:hypothetical protein
MNENMKIQESEYFLSLMNETINEQHFFYFNLSAFLSAARSVLQYALKEADTKPNGRGWYDSAIQNRPVVRFFKDKRDINIHAEPIKPSAEIYIEINDKISLSDAVSITITDKDGNISDQEIVPKSEPTRKIKSDEPMVEYGYRFRDWSGNEDAVDLSRQYIKELKEIVSDGVSKGFITG